jgi:hypothetical protein
MLRAEDADPPAAPTSFCKCTCAGNSTIVALDAPATPQKASPNLRERATKKTCNDCNRQFCLGYPFCTGVKEEQVFTTCFRMYVDVREDGADCIQRETLRKTRRLFGYSSWLQWDC